MNNSIIKKDGDFEVVIYEQCITCKVETNIPKKLDVSLRSNYIEGAGQLCQKCFDSKALVIE